MEPWQRTVERLDRLRKITKEDVLRVANQYLTDNRVVVYRRNGKPEIPSIQKPGFTKLTLDPDRESAMAGEILKLPAKPIEPRWLESGRDYTVMDIAAGRLYAAKNPFDDLFTLGFEFDRGTRQDRALCTALGLDELSGAGDVTAEDFKKKLFALGASINYACGEQDSGVTIAGLDKNLPETLELLRARLETPNIAPDTLKKMVDVTIGAHQDAKKDPEAVMAALGEFARRGKESSVLADYSDKELLALKESDLRGLLKGFLGYKGKVVYVGNRPPEEIAKLVDRPGKYRNAPARRSVRFLVPGKTTIYFTHRDMVQAQVGVYAADGPLDTARALDNAVLSNYLGGGMSSVLFQEVREARSLAYAVWGGYAQAGHKGDDNEAFGQLGCQADKTPEAAELLAQLLKSPPLSQPRFLETRKAIEQNYRTNPIPFRAIPGAIIGWEDQGLSGDPRPARFERLKTYSLDDLTATAKRLSSQPQTIFILGDRTRVGLDAIKKLGDYTEKALDSLFPY
jgi:predicted Zn-dependent peptidase